MNFHFSHGWALAGQILVLWSIASVFAAPRIGHYLRARRAVLHLRRILETERKASVNRLRTNLTVADAEVERRRLAREGVIPISDEQFRERARRAEALGWQDQA